MKSSEYDILWPDEGPASLDSGKPNYNAFISGLLSNPSTTKEDRERIVDLLLKERDKGFVTKEQVVKIIDEYYRDNNQSTNSTQKSNKEPQVELEEYKLPKDTQDFLYAYSRQDDVLRYTCHLIDDDSAIAKINSLCGVEQYDFEKHLELIIVHFNQLRKQYKYVDHRILNLISVYLTGKTIVGKESGWTSALKITENWSCNQLHEWAKAFPNMVPNPGENIVAETENPGFQLSKPYLSNITGNRILDFSELVLYFKSLFHIRADNSLKAILDFVNNNWKIGKEVNVKLKDQCDISYSKDWFFKNIELFTNVDTLIQAYKKIIKICWNYAQGNKLDKPIIELSFYEQLGRIYFCVHHKNTVYGKTVSNAVRGPGEAQRDLIANQINGFCDLFIQAKFEDGNSYEINMWDGQKRASKKIENIEGVKYILKFN